MHNPKLGIDTDLVRRLVDAQFPEWRHLPVSPVASGGWDNRTFHLGDEMTVRLPSAAPYSLQVEKEHRWLPQHAPHLPLPIPMPLAMGEPAAGYPWHWSVYRWIEGETAKTGQITDLRAFALSLADFLVALKRIDPTGGPAPGQHNFHRGGPLTVYDGEARLAIAALEGEIDTQAATIVWEAALAATWHGSPVWFHGDVAWGNLLVHEGRLSAIIDFGTSGVGDPSCDLAIAWTFFEGESRKAFRDRIAVDDATWARGRGWTLWKALITLAGHDANQAEAEKSRRVIDEVLADHWRWT
ncbi:aminoglycoside phosphotransferase family protein [Mesorhizobium sp. M1C.F.Ca.ET.193.01.1.1]|uniref:aminoglycoside phosphotransferase family protein n=1 Tax=unclassified Mesorhizobium TaxID=325217 RepID=UPI000FD20EAC|nr:MULTISPECIES: aminoglycoside phosphotransferase family protein [unclassified Mesorhizobium]TGS92974.1 aminoglycoside phosphotransferase family protein [bacterium M00.F.Ca.ET.177.01.1.1]TGQ50494.1 aminoglycoside phosphotransferase family protein [Mesorhizobium sp. M1C.F.Ca.ET.210.01.1.1]TGQ65674.1 aminoglycoside phosphotransferase family protein [Mesorhizobium sp. M1C.F.Ca.ET.212.01.1.1]TGQ99364.1 aminoglycoside phosphotransferase family protein [Mesorhizobium sp. M1C.F.Ca.ET.204.01.1.1]TGR1